MSTLATSVPEDLEECPVSVKYVYHVIDSASGPVRRDELVDEAQIRPRTLDDALEQLDNRGYLLRSRRPTDLRQVSYEIRDQTESFPHEGGE